MRTGGWLRDIAHTLEIADRRRAMRSVADRSTACRASNAATGSAGGRRGVRSGREPRGSDDGNGNERLKKRRFQLFPPNNPAACFLRRLHLRVFICLPPFPFHARCFHRSAISIRPTPFAAPALALDCSWLVLKSRRSFRKSRGKNAMWSVELVEPAAVKFPELLAGMRLYHCEQVCRLSGKTHLITAVFVKMIKFYLRKNSESNY